MTDQAHSDALAEQHIEKLITHLPLWAGKAIRWIRRPAARWVRMPVAICLIPGGFFGFLPILGLWMLPLGLILLGVDIPIIRRGMHRFINWLAERRPQWFQ